MGFFEVHRWCSDRHERSRAEADSGQQYELCYVGRLAEASSPCACHKVTRSRSGTRGTGRTEKMSKPQVISHQTRRTPP